MKTLPAPVRGWIENENLAANGGLGAAVMENWFPEQSTVRVRGGYLKAATIGTPIVSLLPYKAGGIERLFAASETKIFDISALDDDTVPPPSWANLTSGRWSCAQVTSGGGASYLMAVNGADPLLYFDGTNWFPIVGAAIHAVSYDAMTADFIVGRTLTGGTSGATATIVSVVPATPTTGKLYLTGIAGGPFQDNETMTGSGAGGSAAANGASAEASAIAVTGVTTSDLSHIWTHNERVWAIEGGTLSAWYLAVDTFGGTATEFSMAGVFKEGGSLLFGATWSGDSGSGMADRCVFVTDQGEIAVYDGLDPSSAETWSKIGLYNVGRPVGVSAVKAGGDLLIATTDGIVPLSQIVAKDPAALAVSAVSRPIEPAWRRAIRDNPEHVQMLKWQRASMLIVGYPESDETHVCNMQTGAWAKWTGHDVQCMALYNDLAYFGAADGNVYQIEGAGSDNGAVYVCRLAILPDHLDAPGAHKEVLMARATFRFLAPFRPKLSVAMNYGRQFPVAPSAVTTTAIPALWDVGVWDVSLWDDAPDSEDRRTEPTRWKSVGLSGFSASAQVQIACGASRMPDAELVIFDMLHETGGTVV